MKKEKIPKIEKEKEGNKINLIGFILGIMVIYLGINIDNQFTTYLGLVFSIISGIEFMKK